MTAMFASAYRQLRPVEKTFVDAYVQRIERDAQAANERISNALHRPIPTDVVEASRGMLERPMIVAAISERISQIAADVELTVHRMVKEMMGVAFSSVGDYMTVGEDGQPYFDLAKATPEQLAAIKSIEVEESLRGRKFKFTLHDKLGGMTMLARFMGLLDADNPHWRTLNDRPAPPALPAAATVDDAAGVYGRMING